MATHSEAGAETTVRNGVAKQELADALAVLVEIVDRIIVRILEAIEPCLGVAEFGIDVEQFRIFRCPAAFIGNGEKGFERIRRLQLGLEIDVARQELDDERDHIGVHSVG